MCRIAASHRGHARPSGDAQGAADSQRSSKSREDGAPPSPSLRSQRGLDLFVFFLAEAQTGFGPFISVYLTTEKWTQADIGLVLGVRSLVGLGAQIPGGALVDAVRAERLVAATTVVIIAMSALALTAWPNFGSVLASQVAHAAASSVLGSVIGAISLGLVGHAAAGPRFARNARFASFGVGLTAVGMGAWGHFLSSGGVFAVTAALCIPTLVGLGLIRSSEIDPERAHGGRAHRGERRGALRDLPQNRRLIVFGAAMALFQLANAAMLPQIASVITVRSSEWATVLVGLCIVAPQIVVVALAPAVAQKAEHWGRRPLLLLAFSGLALRAMLFALVVDPYLLVASMGSRLPCWQSSFRLPLRM